MQVDSCMDAFAVLMRMTPTSRWRLIPTPLLVPRRTRRTVKHDTSRSALTSFGMLLLSASSTSSMLRQTVNSQMFSPRRRQLPCCGCSKLLWTAQPRSLCWLACTSNLPLLFPTRPTRSSQSKLDRLHTLHTNRLRCATYGGGDGILSVPVPVSVAPALTLACMSSYTCTV